MSKTHAEKKILFFQLSERKSFTLLSSKWKKNKGICGLVSLTTLSSLQAPCPVSKQQGTLQKHREVKPRAYPEPPGTQQIRAERVPAGAQTKELGKVHGPKYLHQTPSTTRHLPTSSVPKILPLHSPPLGVFLRPLEGSVAQFIMHPTPDRKAPHGPSVEGRLPLENRAWEGKLRYLRDLLSL